MWQTLLEEGIQAEVPSALSYKSDRQLVKYEFELRIPLVAQGAVVNYTFGTDALDISFGIACVSATGVRTEVQPLTRVDSHIEPVTGKFGPFQGESGVLVLAWDNNYAWFNSKQLSYSIFVEYPDDKTVHQAEVQHDREKLTRCLEDMARAERRRQRAQESLADTAVQIRATEAKIVELQSELQQQRSWMEKVAGEDALCERRVAVEQGKAAELALTLVMREGWLDLSAGRGRPNGGRRADGNGDAPPPAPADPAAPPPITEEDMNDL